MHPHEDTGDRSNARSATAVRRMIMGFRETQLIYAAVLVVLGGSERTAAEYQILFEATGLELSRIIPTEAPVSIFEAARAAS